MIAGGGAVVAVVTPPRLQEKVMVALTAARAARVQALEVSRWAGMELGHCLQGAGANTLPTLCHTHTFVIQTPVTVQQESGHCGQHEAASLAPVSILTSSLQLSALWAL